MLNGMNRLALSLTLMLSLPLAVHAQTATAIAPLAVHYPGRYEADADALLTFEGTWYSADCTDVCSNGMAVESDDGSVTLSWYGDRLTLYFLTSVDPALVEVCTDAVCATLQPTFDPPSLFAYPPLLPIGYHETVIRAVQGRLTLDGFTVGDASGEYVVPTWTPAPTATPVAWDLVVTVDPDGNGAGVSVRVPLQIGAGQWVQIGLQTLTMVFVVCLVFVEMTRRAGS